MTQDRALLPKSELQHLLDLLQSDGFETIAPKLEQGAIVYGSIRSVQELPIGWTDLQSPGSYRLEKRNDNAYFGYAVGPHSWKKYLFPPTTTLVRIRRNEKALSIVEDQSQAPRRALIGVRACELHAIGVQDRVFIEHGGKYTDSHYQEARKRLFIVAVECQYPAGSCFCVSMNTGPAIESQRIPLPLTDAPSTANTRALADVILTELDEGFIVRAETESGNDLLKRLTLAPASTQQVEQAQTKVAHAATKMGRALQAEGIREMLQKNWEHPRWDEVANRCLACANCTMVCPTCFCSSVQDVTDLDVQESSRVRTWDSCFNPDFAQVHGGNFRSTVKGRYRQWLTHKFSSWFEQFDVSGCVGCGRCITWCPVGIDVTEEITAIRNSPQRQQDHE
jgi:ferredoxin